MEVQVSIYQALAIKHGLRFYARHAMRINKAYTPKAMLAMATKITGKEFKKGAYMEASDALDAWIKEEHAKQLAVAAA